MGVGSRFHHVKFAIANLIGSAIFIDWIEWSSAETEKVPRLVEAVWGKREKFLFFI